CTTSALPVGTDPITAVYSGNSTYAGNTSNTVSQLVYNQQPTTTAVTCTPNPSGSGASVACTATITYTSGVSPTGTVGFTSNGTAISGCTAVTVASAAATCNTTTLAVGTDSIVATYSGDSNNGGSTSSAYSESVLTADTVALVSGTN